MVDRALQRVSAFGTREMDGDQEGAGRVAPCLIVDGPRLRVVEELFPSIFSVRARRSGGDVASVLSQFAMPAPAAPLAVVGDAVLCCAWIEPRAWLVIGGDRGELAAGSVLRGTDVSQRTDASLQVTDVSHRYSAFRISGDRADDLLSGALSLTQPLAPSRCARAKFAEECEVFVQRFAQDYRLLIDAPLAHFAAQWMRDYSG